MIRCLTAPLTHGVRARTPLMVASVLLAMSCLLLPCAASAQQAFPQRIPPIPAKARSGMLRVTTPPDVLLNGQPARLAPGARIRNRHNLLVVSGTLIGQALPVAYTLDMLGLVHEAWILTPAEATAREPVWAPPSAN